MTTETATRLYVDAIDAKPQDYSWDSASLGGEYGDNDRPNRWELVFPDVSAWTAAQCWEWMRDHGQTETPEFRDCADAEDVAERWRETVRECMNDEPDAFSPMMNYAYPLPELRMSPEAAQATLETIRTCCVVALIDGEPFLALAGGGMDLSWDICRAYIALGYYPPAHYAGRLPNQGETDTETARIAVESCRIAAGWAQHAIERAELTLAQTIERKGSGLY